MGKVIFTKYEFKCLVDDNKLLFADTNGFAFIYVDEPYELNEELVILKDDKLTGTKVTVTWDENIDEFVKATFVSRECRKYIQEQQWLVSQFL